MGVNLPQFRACLFVQVAIHAPKGVEQRCRYETAK
jgi:hypothetical protein